MILPYSTDAPIYHFPWMTIVLIVANCLAFALTGMGYHDEGWLLQYGNGMHPLEWVAFNFLHFGVGHLVGNMFFLWAFGIVVEGKLGWWKFLGIYLTIGTLGGFLIQLTMLNYKPKFDLSDLAAASSHNASSWFEPTPAFAQDDEGADEPDMDDNGGVPAGNFPAGNFPIDNMAEDDEMPFNPNAMKDIERQLAKLSRPGAGGSTLIVFALLGIVLVWAPKNEIMCFWIGLNAGTFELEYIYFCGLKIGTEILGAVLLAPGFEITSEIANALGAVMGFGVGAAFVKLNWVDCENWDLFAYAQNKHGSMEHVGSWQDAAAISIRNDKKIVAPAHDEDEPRTRSGKKKRVLPKLRELSSLDDDIPDEEPIEVLDDLEESDESPRGKSSKLKPSASRNTSPKTEKSTSGSKLARNLPPLPALPPIPAKEVATQRPDIAAKGIAEADDASPLGRIRSALAIDKPNDALAEFRRQRASDPAFQLPKGELRQLADIFFKAQNVRDSKPFLEEFIERFADDADRQRVKLAVLFVKFLKRPTTAMKLLAKVDRYRLPDDYKPIYEQAARQAQQMIADGMTDAT